MWPVAATIAKLSIRDIDSVAWSNLALALLANATMHSCGRCQSLCSNQRSDISLIVCVASLIFTSAKSEVKTFCLACGQWLRLLQSLLHLSTRQCCLHEFHVVLDADWMLLDRTMLRVALPQ
jgi:hypothetical protein